MIEANDLTYYVPTMGRLRKKPATLEMLRTAGLMDRVTLFCPHEEEAEWRRRFPDLGRVWIQPPDVNGIGQVRGYLFLNASSRYFMMMDDDVTFHHRMSDGSIVSAASDPRRLNIHLDGTIRYTFERFAAIGIGGRAFCDGRPFVNVNKHTGGWAFGYDRERARPHLEPILGRTVIHEDTDWCLTLLEAGLDNAVLSYLVASSRRVATSREDGGCGVYRTPELVRQQNDLLIKLHPGTVEWKAPRAGLPDTTQYVFKINWRRFKR